MLLRILVQPTGTIDGIAVDHFRIGGVYELGTQVACVFLAEGWAALADDDAVTVVRRPPSPDTTIAPLVMVVDDDSEMRQMTTSLLTDHGYQVIVAAHGRDAIERLREQCPDVIVLDLNMPVMNGWEFRRQQRELSDSRRAAVPVLLMTGEDDATTHAETLRAVGVIKKPCDPADLLDAVSATIRPQACAADRSIRPWSRRTRRPTLRH